MKEINITELYDYYKDTLNKVGVFLYNESDLIIEYNLFEEFDIGIHTFFHYKSLQRLYIEGYINSEEMKKSMLLREMVLELEYDGEWNVESFKKSSKWRSVMELSDMLK
ncbi:hypothetical protein ACR78F_19040 [Sphingobacterium spiritivorum]|uniref:hypothetical protein n=1 Tax=Sphingobacterium spiritivorum TaxID=258 RepID=UPI003DA1EDDD